MIILDENIIASQREQLKKWRIHFSRVGVHIGYRGIDDVDIMPLIQKMPKPTLFTRDSDFFKKYFCHKKYCIVFLNINQDEVAVYIRRFLRHPQFNTFAKRQGLVIRLVSSGFHFWELNVTHEHTLDWKI